MGNKKTFLAKDKIHTDACHERWLKRRNRNPDVLGYRDEFTVNQCFSCQYYISLTGLLIDDWGVCSNENPPFDGIVRFEHDRCYFHSEIEEWTYLDSDKSEPF